MPLLPVPMISAPLAIERQVVRRVVARLPELIPDAVGRDAVDRALERAAILARRAPAIPLPPASTIDIDVISADTDAIGARTTSPPVTRSAPLSVTDRRRAGAAAVR